LPVLLLGPEQNGLFCNIKLGAAETFPTGGQLTVLGGLTTAAGGTLTGPAVFTISKSGKSIKLS